MKFLFFYFLASISFLFSLQVPTPFDPSYVPISSKADEIEEVQWKKTLLETVDNLIFDFADRSKILTKIMSLGHDEKLYHLSEFLKNTKVFSIEENNFFKVNKKLIKKMEILIHLLDFAKHLKNNSFFKDATLFKMLCLETKRHSEALMTAITPFFFEIIENAFKEESDLNRDQLYLFEQIFSCFMKALLLGFGTEKIYKKLQANLKTNSLLLACNFWHRKLLNFLNFFENNSIYLTDDFKELVNRALECKYALSLVLLENDFESFQKNIVLSSRSKKTPLQRWIIDLQYQSPSTMNMDFIENTIRTVCKVEKKKIFLFLIKHFTQIFRVNAKIDKVLTERFLLSIKYVLDDPQHSALMEEALIENFSLVFGNDKDSAQSSKLFLIFFLDYVLNHKNTFPFDILSPNLIKKATNNFCTVFPNKYSYSKSENIVILCGIKHFFNDNPRFSNDTPLPPFNILNHTVSILEYSESILDYLDLYEKNDLLKSILNFTRQLKIENFGLKDEELKTIILSCDKTIARILSSLRPVFLDYLNNGESDAFFLTDSVSLIAKALTLGYKDQEITDALKNALQNTFLLGEAHLEEKILKCLELRRAGNASQTETKRIRYLENSPLAFFFLDEIEKILPSTQPQMQKCLSHWNDFFENKEKDPTSLIKNTLKAIKEGELSANGVLLNILIHFPDLFDPLADFLEESFTDNSIYDFLQILVQKCDNTKLQKIGSAYLKYYSPDYPQNLFFHLDSHFTTETPSLVTFVYVEERLPYLEKLGAKKPSRKQYEEDSFDEEDFSENKTFEEIDSSDSEQLKFSIKGDLPHFINNFRSIFYFLVFEGHHKSRFTLIFSEPNKTLIKKCQTLSPNFALLLDKLFNNSSLDFSIKQLQFDVIDRAFAMGATEEFDYTPRFALSFKLTLEIEEATEFTTKTSA